MWTERELTRAIWREYDKPERFSALLRMRPYLREPRFWHLFGRVWANSESLYLHLDEVERVLGESTPWKALIMDQEERTVLGKLPQYLTIWRGGWKDNILGWSWTRDRSKAYSFANRSAMDGRPIVVTGRIRREAVIAVKLGRNENEIIVNPARVSITTLTKLKKHPRDINKKNILFQRLHAEGSEFLFGGREETLRITIQFMLTRTKSEDIAEEIERKLRIYEAFGTEEKSRVYKVILDDLRTGLIKPFPQSS